uniref:Signal recognition particle 54 kDa protein n=1 Tax=Bicosoecida sp. CB-2014 TaxID=1486930 RepID=A0A7S1CI41_9STRA|mmetsp:Transcript_25092/g.87525  ORF Transcript_25092/g.87525 Transcript_25092/m.87525 type:complete len:535 (+) Transcript_25092:241-1845(+)
MVLAELGLKITSALRKVATATRVDDALLREVLNEVGRALLEADVSPRLIRKLQDNVRMQANLEDSAAGHQQNRVVQRAVYSELVNMLDPGRDAFKPKKGQSNVIMFVGLQGAGKTTTVAKYAYYYQQKGWKVAMVCADTFRAGAFDQLRQNATRVRVPFYGSYSEPDPVKIAAEGVAQFRDTGYEIIIVDTSGRHKQESALFEEMQQVEEATKPDEIIFTMDSTIGQAAYDQAAAFREAVAVGSCIMTKLDGGAKGGGALAAVAATESPIIFTGTGERFEDLDEFDAKRFVRRLLGMGDMEGLMTTFQEKVDLEAQQEVLDKLLNSKKKQGLSFRDMRSQFETVMSLGPLDKVMGMLPGPMSQLMPKGAEGEGANRIKRFMTIMDSMTNKELDSGKELNESQMRRLARGSGTSMGEVMVLIDTHQRFAKMFAKMGKTGLLKGGGAGMEAQMQRNPQQVMQNIMKSVDPRVLQQMGGAGGFASMLQGAMGADGGGPDMAAMMQAMGGAGGMGGLAGMMGGRGGGGGKVRVKQRRR